MSSVDSITSPITSENEAPVKEISRFETIKNNLFLGMEQLSLSSQQSTENTEQEEYHDRLYETSVLISENMGYIEEIQNLKQKIGYFISITSVLVCENKRFIDEIEHLKQKNHYLVSAKCDRASKNEEYVNKIQDLKKKNCDIVPVKYDFTSKNEAYVDEIQNLKEKNLDLVSLTSVLVSKNEAYVDEIQQLEKDIHILVSKNEAYAKEIRQLKTKRPARVKYDNSNTYSHLNLSPVLVKKSYNIMNNGAQRRLNQILQKNTK